MRHQQARHSGTDIDHRVGSFLGIRHRTRSFIAPAIAVISHVVADDGDIVFAHRRAGKEVDHLPKSGVVGTPELGPTGITPGFYHRQRACVQFAGLLGRNIAATVAAADLIPRMMSRLPVMWTTKHKS